jgi:subtilisin family serine protease
VWSDSVNRNNLSLKYYNSSQVELTTVTRYTTTESARGTESHYSNYGFYVPSGSGTYYLRVVNPSNVSQFFHIYDVWGARVTFQTPDPFYTVGQPSTADYCLSVGAHTSRINWTASNGSSFSYNGAGALNDIAPFSSRGPRIDGMIKPNITAPGSAIISMRDRDVLNVSNNFWVDDDGTLGGNANYYVMQGTSMATPLAAGSVALILQKFPGVSPSEIYDAIQNNSVVDAITGSVPNNTWGYGKLDVQRIAFLNGVFF